MSNCPKISYLVSTYDSGSYLNTHLNDLLNNQTDPDFEVVIVNPNSPGTDDLIAKKWAARDSRVNYIFHPEREWYGESWLRAWKAAKGEYVSNSNTDDLHHPDFTRVLYETMLRRSVRSDVRTGFAYTGIAVVDENGQWKNGGLKPPFDYDVFSRECWAGPQVTWCNWDQFRDMVDWDLMARRAKEYRSAFDYWLWLYFMSLGYHGHSIQEILTVYTQRPDSIENSNKWQNNWETYSAISEFFPENFDTHLTHAAEFAIFDDRPDKAEWIASKNEN